MSGTDLHAVWLSDNEIKLVLLREKELTQGYALNDIFKLIDNAHAFTDGEWMDTIVALSFPNGNTIYHQISDGGGWNHIWLADGYDALAPFSSPWMWTRIALINDSDGFVNIHEKPNVHSKTVRTIKDNEIFYFTPISKSEWYPVSLKEYFPSI